MGRACPLGLRLQERRTVPVQRLDKLLKPPIRACGGPLWVFEKYRESRSCHASVSLLFCEAEAEAVHGSGGWGPMSF